MILILSHRLNSPFLLFSLIGILNFRPNRFRNKLLVLLVFYTILVAYLNPDFEGGFTPRYVRHSEPIIVILSIFLSHWLDEELKKKSKITLFLFGIIALVSILNSTSISIRTDWNYEKITDLVSYDIVLWPWISSEEGNLTLDLTKLSEQANWKLSWEKGCNPPITEPRFSELGIETGPCSCAFRNNATRKILIPDYFNALKISVCSRKSGNDGTLGYVYIDGKEISKFQIASSTCKDIIIDIQQFADNKEHLLTLTSYRNRRCNEEVIIWRKVELIKFEKEFPRYEFDIVNEIEKWYSENTLCPIEVDFEGIITDYCHCYTSGSANYRFNTKSKNLTLKITACASFAGEDGVIGEILIDNNLLKKVYIGSNKCINIKKSFEISPGIHILTLKPQIYGECDAEIIKWEKIILS